MNIQTDGLVGVFFCDGGARPNPGDSGAGVYGFLYNPGKEIEINTSRKHPVYNYYGVQHSTTVLADLERSKISISNDVLLEVSTRSNKEIKTAELTEETIPLDTVDMIRNYEVKHHIDIIHSIDNNSTNNKAEIIALVDALSECIKLKLKQAVIYSDSAYAIRLSELKRETLVKRRWMSSAGTPLQNKEQIIELLDVIESLGDVDIKIAKVKAHVEYYANDRADDNATKALMIASRGDMNNLDVSYTTELIEKVEQYVVPRAIHKKHIYVSRSLDDISRLKDTPFVDHLVMGNHGKNIRDIARPTSGSSYTIAYLTKRFDLLHDVVDVIRSANKWIDLISVDTAVLFNKKVLDDYSRNGTRFYKLGTINNRTVVSNSISNDIAEVLNVAWLAYHGIDMLMSFQRTMEEFVLGGREEDRMDITHLLFDSSVKTVTTKKGLPNKEVPVMTSKPDVFLSKFIDVIVDHSEYKGDKLRLVYNHDLPPANTMISYSKKADIKVELCILKVNPDLYRYFTLMTTSDGVVVNVAFPSNSKLILNKS